MESLFSVILLILFFFGFDLWQSPFGRYLKGIYLNTISWAKRHKFLAFLCLIIWPISSTLLGLYAGIIITAQAFHGGKKLIKVIKAWDLKKRREESQRRQTLEKEKASLRKETRKLEEENRELRQKIRSLDGTEALSSSANFIEIITGATDLFDRQIRRIEENTSLDEYQKAQRMRDWESLRDIQIGRILEGESK